MILTPFINGFLNILMSEVVIWTVAITKLDMAQMRHICFISNFTNMNIKPKATLKTDITAF